MRSHCKSCKPLEIDHRSSPLPQSRYPLDCGVDVRTNYCRDQRRNHRSLHASSTTVLHEEQDLPCFHLQLCASLTQQARPTVCLLDRRAIQRSNSEPTGPAARTISATRELDRATESARCTHIQKYRREPRWRHSQQRIRADRDSNATGEGLKLEMQRDGQGLSLLRQC